MLCPIWNFYLGLQALLRATRSKQITALAEHHDAVSYTTATLGQTLTALRRHEEAEAMLRSSYTQQGLTLGPEHPETWRSASALGHVLLLARGSSAAKDEARMLLEMALAKQLEQLGPKHAETLRTERRLKTAAA